MIYDVALLDQHRLKFKALILAAKIKEFAKGYDTFENSVRDFKSP